MPPTSNNTAGRKRKYGSFSNDAIRVATAYHNHDHDHADAEADYDPDDDDGDDDDPRDPSDGTGDYCSHCYHCYRRTPGQRLTAEGVEPKRMKVKAADEAGPQLQSRPEYGPLLGQTGLSGQVDAATTPSMRSLSIALTPDSHSSPQLDRSRSVGHNVTTSSRDVLLDNPRYTDMSVPRITEDQPPETTDFNSSMLIQDNLFTRLNQPSLDDRPPRAPQFLHRDDEQSAQAAGFRLADFGDSTNWLFPVEEDSPIFQQSFFNSLSIPASASLGIGLDSAAETNPGINITEAALFDNESIYDSSWNLASMAPTALPSSLPIQHQFDMSYPLEMFNFPWPNTNDHPSGFQDKGMTASGSRPCEASESVTPLASSYTFGQSSPPGWDRASLDSSYKLNMPSLDFAAMPIISQNYGHNQQMQMNTKNPPTIQQADRPRDRRRNKYVENTQYNRSPTYGSLSKTEQTTTRCSSISIDGSNDSNLFRFSPDLASEQKPPPESSSAEQSAPQKKQKKTFAFFHTFVKEDEFQEAEDESKDAQISQKSRRRRAAFDDSTRAKVAQVRQSRACWNCVVRRIACDHVIKGPSTNDKGSPSLSRGISYHNDRLNSYTELFCPEQAVGRFLETKVNQFIESSISGYTSNRFQTYISFGSKFPSIAVAPYEINPSTRDILAVKELVTDERSGTSSLVTSYSLPLALQHSPRAIEELKTVIDTYFEDLIDANLKSGKVLEFGDSQIAKDVYEVISIFYRANSNTIFLRQMLKLYLFQYFSTISITLDPASALQTSQNLQRPTQFPYMDDTRLRLINMQVKSVMRTISHQLYQDVLGNLDKTFRKFTPEAWALAFCCIMILRLCAEVVQVTADVRTIAAMTNACGPGGAEKTRSASIDACRKIEDIPIRRVTDIFHDKHRTKRHNAGRSKDKTFNPLRDDLNAKDQTALGPAGVELVSNLRRVSRKHRNDLDSLSSVPSFNAHCKDPVRDHMRFRDKNPGRLVAGLLVDMLQG